MPAGIRAGTSGDAYIVVSGADRIAIDSSGNVTVTGNFNTAGTAYTKVAVGTTAERATAVTGGIRFNTSTGNFEGYTGTAWTGFVDRLKGGGADRVFWENDKTVDNDYTITAGKNAMSAGPITVSTNRIVTVPDGVVWTIV
jgi:hypothetical protein